MKTKFNLFLIAFFSSIFFIPFLALADTDLLSKEEVFWLKSRNNTIVVYPEKSFPPFSYTSSSGTPLGLSIDFLEIIAEKLGVQITYLPARSLSQILDDVKTGKGDVVTSLSETPERSEYLYFTDSYVSVGTVIVMRKDVSTEKTLTLNDLNGDKVAVSDGYALEGFVRKNYPRVILEPVTDDEIALQQVVLGEVEAAVMDIASLSFYLSKQVLSSVKVVGNAGYEYKLAFAVPKDKQILQSILDKGLTQISTSDRSLLNEKWIVLPDAKVKEISWNEKVQTYFGSFATYIAFGVLVGLILILLFRQGRVRNRFFRKAHSVKELKEDIQELEEANQMLAEELKEVQEHEMELTHKIHKFDK